MTKLTVNPILDFTWLAPSSNGDNHVAATEVPPSIHVALPSKEDFDKSPHYPLIMTPNPAVSGQSFFGSSDPAQQLPLDGVGGPIPHENSFWKGVLEVHVANTPTMDEKKFVNKKRMYHVAIQGRYKFRHKAASYYAGAEFSKPGRAPAYITQLLMTAFSKTLCSSVRVDGTVPQPYAMNSVLASWQLINVSRPGEEPGLWEAKEDMRLMSPKLANKDGRPMTSDQRRKFCDNPANTEDLYYEPEFVYTQHVWCHMLDMSQCKLALTGLLKMDIAFAVNGQPFPMVMRNFEQGHTGLGLLIWHKRMFYPEEDSDGLAGNSSSSSRQRLKKLGMGLHRIFGGP